MSRLWVAIQHASEVQMQISAKLGRRNVVRYELTVGAAIMVPISVLGELSC